MQIQSITVKTSNSLLLFIAHPHSPYQSWLSRTFSSRKSTVKRILTYQTIHRRDRKTSENCSTEIHRVTHNVFLQWQNPNALFLLMMFQDVFFESFLSQVYLPPGRLAASRNKKSNPRFVSREPSKQGHKHNREKDTEHVDVESNGVHDTGRGSSVESILGKARQPQPDWT
jgi:hypothetical protein